MWIHRSDGCMQALMASTQGQHHVPAGAYCGAAPAANHEMKRAPAAQGIHRAGVGSLTGVLKLPVLAPRQDGQLVRTGWQGEACDQPTLLSGLQMHTFSDYTYVPSGTNRTLVTQQEQPLTGP